MSGIVFWAAAGIVAYTYAGYPLLVAALSRLRPAPADHSGHTPPLTLVIAAYNEEAVIGAKLHQSLALDYPPDRLQIVVAADGSDDRTVEIASSFADRGVVVLHRPERAGKLAAITRAVAASTGDVIVFSDANNRYDEAALREMAAPFADPEVGAVSGRKAVVDDDALGYSEGLYWRYESAVKRWETRLGCTVGVNGEIIAVRRELFATAPPGIINDDTWLARLVLRGGHRIAYAERALSVERVSADAAAERERRTRMVAGQIQVLLHAGRELPWRRPLVTWQLISHKLLRPLVPLWMGAALVASLVALAFPGSGTGAAAVATLAPPWNVAAVAAQAAFYLLAAAGNRLTGPLGKVAYIPRFLWDSNVAAVRGAARILRGRQTPLWDRVARRPEPLEPVS
ncbi:MAG: glycosyltransferase family 2 protein [Actinobacteria bacterium]|nr:glycosyltransferase family 2 protein [Actinomycetota bacterium]